MNLIVNGELINFNKNSFSIEELILELNLIKTSILVELNSNIIEKETYFNTYLKDQDKIELIKIVGGG